MFRTTLGLALALLLTSGAAVANTDNRKIDDRGEFVSLVEGRELTLPGIRLTVTPAGEIKGRAYGRPVSGAWRWEAGYFCRDLFWGQRDLGPNCQMVSLVDNKLRFTSDRGAGQYADLNLR